jgi:hypothetical protein
MQNTPSFFEGLIIELLVKMGYGGSRPDAAAQLGRSGDGGVDGVINEDRLGLDRVYLQAKRYSALPTPFEDKRLACLGKDAASKAHCSLVERGVGPNTAAQPLDRLSRVEPEDIGHVEELDQSTRSARSPGGRRRLVLPQLRRQLGFRATGLLGLRAAAPNQATQRALASRRTRRTDLTQGAWDSGNKTKR